jgi:hypothetical protein
MKLSNYLNESNRFVIYDIDEAAKILKKECRQYIRETGKMMFELYRGVANAPSTPKFYIQKRFSHLEKRRPRDTIRKIHKYFNDKFEDIFGWPVRNGVFVSGEENVADTYGKAFVFFPAGKYEYVWSPRVRDLTNAFEEPYERPGATMYNLLGQTDKEIDQLLDTYKDTDLKKAILSPNEISFNCEYYYIVNTNIDDPTDDFIEFQKKLLK